MDTLYRYFKELQRAKWYIMIPKRPDLPFINVKLNINECFISFGNLNGICT